MNTANFTFVLTTHSADTAESRNATTDNYSTSNASTFTPLGIHSIRPDDAQAKEETGAPPLPLSPGTHSASILSGPVTPRQRKRQARATPVQTDSNVHLSGGSSSPPESSASAVALFLSSSSSVVVRVR